MTVAELKSVMEDAIRRDRQDPESYRPVVAIGHTKDLTDLDSVRWFLEYLRASRVPVRTFADAYPTLKACVQSSRHNFDRTTSPVRH
jgi:hypothetical protein